MLIGGLAAVGWTAALVYFDVTSRRLPNWLTLPVASLAVVACIINPIGWWGLLWPLAYVVTGPGIGGGDVKLAVSLGVVCAMVAGLGGLLVAIFIASLITVVIAAVQRRRDLPHGPSMLAAAWMVGLYGHLSSAL